MRTTHASHPYIRFALLALAGVLIVALLGGTALRIWGEQRFDVVARDVPDPKLESGTPMVDTTLAAPDHSSGGVDTFRTLGPAGQALEARLELADFATQTLDVQYYDFQHDASGRALLGRLAGAADRGVTVRLLLDDIGIGRRADCLARLSDQLPSLTIRLFNPTALRSDARLFEFAARFPRASRRMHNKAMTADRTVSIIGGRNISDLYFDGDGVDVGFTDFDVLIAGEITGKIVDSFEAYWHSGLSFDVRKLATNERDENCGPEIVAIDAPAIPLFIMMDSSLPIDMDAPPGQSDRSEIRDDAQSFTTEAKLIVDPPEKVITPLGASVNHSGAGVAQLLASAQQELLLSSPYFVPSGRGVPLFTELLARGVKVSILTNSLASNDVPAVHASYAGYRKELLRLGVELYEFKPLTGESHDWSLLDSERASLHAKTFVIDASNVFVGSFNLDPRSFFHNTEMGVVLESADFGQVISTRWHELLPQIAYRLELGEEDALRWHETLDDGGERIHHHDPMTTATQRLTVRMLSWLPLEWLM